MCAFVFTDINSPHRVNRVRHHRAAPATAGNLCAGNHLVTFYMFRCYQFRFRPGGAVIGAGAHYHGQVFASRLATSRPLK